MFVKYLLRGTCLAALFCLTAACGGSGSTASSGPVGVTNPPPPAPVPVKGIAIPESVSVVTATNAAN
jgi:hypothetical protein